MRGRGDVLGQVAPQKSSGTFFRGQQFTGLLARERFSLSDGPLGHLKNPMRGFFKLFLRFFVNRGVSLAAASDEGSALRPAIFREKLSKAFFVLGRGSTKEHPFR